MTDWRLYDSAYTERFMPIDGLSQFDSTSVVRFCKNIRNNRLLLVTFCFCASLFILHSQPVITKQRSMGWKMTMYIIKTLLRWVFVWPKTTFNSCRTLSSTRITRFQATMLDNHCTNYYSTIYNNRNKHLCAIYLRIHRRRGFLVKCWRGASWCSKPVVPEVHDATSCHNYQVIVTLVNYYVVENNLEIEQQQLFLPKKKLLFLKKNYQNNKNNKLYQHHLKMKM